MEHYDSILNHLLEGDKAEVIYLDYAKAFDKVDFGIVLKKAEPSGIKGNIINFLHAFSMDRTQPVVVNGILSDPPSLIRSFRKIVISGRCSSQYMLVIVMKTLNSVLLARLQMILAA